MRLYLFFLDEFDESEDEVTEAGDGNRKRGKRVMQHIDPTAVEELCSVLNNPKPIFTQNWTINIHPETIPDRYII